MSSKREGFIRGRHFTTYAADVKALRRAGDNLAAITLLYKVMDAAEAESEAFTREDLQRVERSAEAGTIEHTALAFGRAPAMLGGRLPPGWYEQAAIIHRKAGDHDAEIAVVERYVRGSRQLTDDDRLIIRLRKLTADDIPM